MNIFKISFGRFAIILLCILNVTNGNTWKTALDMIREKLCVCPCGNPRGGKLYETINERLNWFEAVSYCDSLGMSIVTIKDANDRRLLQLHLEENRSRTRSGRKSQTPYWIGANNLATGQGLRWGLTGQQVQGTAEWGAGLAPSNQRTEPVCVYILGDTMKWSASSCDDEPRQFICEY